MEHALEKLGCNLMAIRSSAIGEDAPSSSFAGLHDTFLCVKNDLNHVIDMVKACWASIFNDRAIIYRMRKGMKLFEGMAVIVQEMIPATVSGVTFTKDPMNKKHLLIEACYGLGDILVGGMITPDQYFVNRNTLKIERKIIGKKTLMHRVKNDGSETVKTDEDKVDAQVLTDEQIRRITKLCLEIEGIFGIPQDVEWCLDDDELFWLLQARPVTG